ncbi:conserved hypothetical protein [Theileria equi strain WA]|uniref:GTPase Der n=1 Tax=Theileria equi strain WA TaxID=1537102 RepID=L1LC84_THEEQ|nr:conserved hypothetical protein [Theileria equi strain WA]EKX72956.1 conserved hypothetical protein [Theileria equi strain WA]|eukprot:XP_004832408.1 conserved hypothetical protein [Theileria equi strain WA]
MLIALVGRSNVGKSSLFNALITRVGGISNIFNSVVSDKPGTTRDAKHGRFYLLGNKITLIDTGGIEHSFLREIDSKNYANCTSLVEKIEQDACSAVKNSNLVFFVLDGKEGVTPLDIQMSSKIRRWVMESSNNPEVKLIVNKLEKKDSVEYYEGVGNCISECHDLDFGDPIFVSAQQNHGIEELRNIIKSKLKNKDIKKLEEMAILSQHVPYIENLDSYNEAEDEDQHYEIDKSIRVCSSVRGSYRPNDQWLKLLDKICGGVPFSKEENDKFIIPSIFSPAEQLAQLYLPNNLREDCVGEADGINAPEDTSQSAPDESGHADHDFTSTTTSGDDKKKVSKPQISIEPTVNPLSIVILGSIDSGRERLVSLLCGERVIHARKEDEVSPNWHSSFSKWNITLQTENIIQPVELLTTAALNLGGSLGKLASRQTIALLRKCDFAVFCIDYTKGERNVRDTAAKVTLSKREVAWLTRATRLNKPIVIAVLTDKGSKKCSLSDDTPLSHEFESIPIISIPMDSSSSSITKGTSKSINKLKTTVHSLLHRSKQTIETNTLNAWLRAFTARWPPPWFDGAKVNLKFAAQVRSNPPTFVLWTNVFSAFPQHYLRQLKAALSDEFELKGVPIRIILRTTFKPSKNVDKTKIRRKLFDKL